MVIHEIIISDNMIDKLQRTLANSMKERAWQLINYKNRLNRELFKKICIRRS